MIGYFDRVCMFGVRWRHYYTIPGHAFPCQSLSKRKAQTVAYLMVLAGWELTADAVKRIGQRRESIVLKQGTTCR